MPLPSGTISLSNVGYISGAYNMDATNARKLCGINLTSGVSWSLSDARGKSWVISTPNIGANGFTFYGTGYFTLNDYSPGVYTAAVYMNAYQTTYNYGDGDYETDYLYLFSSMADTGGGFTSSQPYEYMVVVYYSWGDYVYDTLYGNLSGAGY